MQSSFFVARALAIALMFALSRLGYYPFLWLTHGLLITHYGLALAYSDNSPLASKQGVVLGTVIVAFSAALSYYNSVFIFTVIFGLHHCLTEAYFGKTKRSRFDEALDYSFHLSVYLFYVRESLPLLNFITGWWFFLPVSLYLVRTIRDWRREGFAVKGDVLFLGLAAFSLQSQIGLARIQDIFMYHVLLWFVLPLFIKKYNWAWKAKFTALSIVGGAAICCLVFLLPFTRDNEIMLTKYAGTIGYFHVALSIITSPLNPGFLKSLWPQFQKRIGVTTA